MYTDSDKICRDAALSVRIAGPEDMDALVALGLQLWPENTPETMRAEFTDTLQDSFACFFLLYDHTGLHSTEPHCYAEPVGFAQAQLRHDYVEGTHTSPVGYLEGIFVKEIYRRRGYAGVLVRACEDWAAKQGCTEFASDCPLENTVSYAFHRSMGFAEANRIVCFTKKLSEKQ